ncbi:cytochrome P450 [Massilia endophytica]|uniref:cytochrome P450 n=1 Tax=Massilia endophytica TaxID=2899220 RepID=UPI001E30EC17|nr:cytochrome P450 [Massilia endophytica]UGQ48223.1 cytochrome P450 [Massilia endophytica]
MSLNANAASSAAPVRRIDDLPGPRGLPLLGNALQLKPRRIHLQMEQWAAEYGPVFRARLGRRAAVVFSDPADITAILRERPDTFRRPAITAEVSAELGGQPGVFLAEGADWRHQRRMVMQAFAPHAIKAYFPLLTKVGARLQERWGQAAREGQAIDLGADLKRYTVDIIAGLAFGAEVNTVEKGDDVIQQHMENVLSGVARRSLMPLPYWRYVRLPVDRRLEHSSAEFTLAVNSFVAEARNAMAADPGLRSAPQNLLQAMIAATEQPDSGLGDEAVVGNVITMLLGGEDTTASVLGWMIWLLSRNPEALRRAQQEVLEHVPDVANMTMAQADALDFIDACAHESMRIKPAAPFIPLQTVKDTEMGGVALPKDTIVWCVMRHAAMAEHYFPQPEHFKPERWLEGGGAARAAALPFGGGPRMCPGRYLSLLEIKVAMAMLLGRFDIESVEAVDGLAPEEVMGFVMAPAPMRMRLRLR